MEVEISDKAQKDVLDLDMSVGILDENDPDSARFMVLIRNAMEDLQQQIQVERSLYHKSRDELTNVEGKSRKLETELSLERERNAQLAQELERLEQLISEQNECNDTENDKDNYWELYTESLRRIDELESTISNDIRAKDLENKIIELTNEISSYKDVISDYKKENKKLEHQLDTIKESNKFENDNRGETIKEYENKIHDLVKKLDIEKMENEAISDQYRYLQENLTRINKILESNNYSTVDEIIDDIKQKNEAIVSWKTKFNDLENSVHNYSEKEIEIGEKEVLIASREANLKSKEESLNEFEEQLKNKERNIDIKDKELEQRAKKISNLENEILEKQREYEAYVDDLNMREQTFNKMVEEYSVNIERVQKEQESNHVKRTFEMEKTAIELERRVKELEENKTKFEGYKKLEEEKIKREADFVKKELESYRDELNKKEIELKSHQHEQDNMKESLDLLKHELEDKEKVLAGKSCLLEEKERLLHAKLVESNEKSHNDDEIDKIKTEYENSIKELEEILSKKNGEIECLKLEIEESIKKNSIESSRLESRLHELETRESSVNDLQSQLNSQKLDLENKQKEFDLYINELESRQKEFEDFWLELDKRQKSISIKEKELESRELFLNTQKITLSESEKRSLSEKEHVLFERENNLNKREQRFAERERILVERENKLIQKERGLLEKEIVINDLEREVNSLNQKTKVIEEGLAIREVKAGEKEVLNRNKESIIIKREAVLTEREESCTLKESDLRERERLCDERRRVLVEKQKELEEKELYLDEREKQLQLERKPLIDELIRIEEKDKQLLERELEIQRSEDILHEMEGILKSREKELLDEKYSSSNREREEIGELRKMIGDLEIKNKEMEKETQKTYQILQQQIREEMKQKEDLLYTILHLHKQINEIVASTNTSESSETNVQQRNASISTSATSSVKPNSDGGDSLENKSIVNSSNNQVMISLEKTMNKLFEKLQATENREKNLLKELRQLTEKGKSSKHRNNSVCIDSNKEDCVPYTNDIGVSSKQNNSYSGGENLSTSSSLPLTNNATVRSEHNILSTHTNNSPILYPESPMVLMPVLNDIKNELNELKKSTESNMLRVTQVDERTGPFSSDTLNNSNVEFQVNSNHPRLLRDGSADICIHSGGNLNLQKFTKDTGSIHPQYNQTHLNSASVSLPGGEHDNVNTGIPKICSLIGNARPSSGSVASGSNLHSRDTARRLLEHELNSLKQWKRGMKQWDSEFSNSHNKQEEAIAWKQFIDQQMQVIAKKLERRLSAALQK